MIITLSTGAFHEPSFKKLEMIEKKLHNISSLVQQSGLPEISLKSKNYVRNNDALVQDCVDEIPSPIVPSPSSEKLMPLEAVNLSSPSLNPLQVSEPESNKILYIRDCVSNNVCVSA